MKQKKYVRRNFKIKRKKLILKNKIKKYKK